MRWRTLSLLLLLVSALPGHADTLLTLKSHVDSFQLMGETTPAKDTEVKVWIGADRRLPVKAEFAMPVAGGGGKPGRVTVEFKEFDAPVTINAP